MWWFPSSRCPAANPTNESEALAPHAGAYFPISLNQPRETTDAERIACQEFGGPEGIRNPDLLNAMRRVSSTLHDYAGIAQLAEQLFCKQQVCH